MKNKLIQVTYEIQLNPGESLQLPDQITQQLEGGIWRITLEKIADFTLPEKKINPSHKRREIESFFND